MLARYLSISSVVIFFSWASIGLKLEDYGINVGIQTLILMIAILVHTGWTNKAEIGNVKSSRFWIGVFFIISSHGIDWFMKIILASLGASVDVVKDVSSFSFVLAIVVGNLLCFVLPDPAPSDSSRAGPFRPRR